MDDSTYRAPKGTRDILWPDSARWRTLVEVFADVVGAAGYTGEELLRLLSRHPQVEIGAVTSRASAGQLVGSVFPKLADLELHFIEPDIAAIATIPRHLKAIVSD